MVSIFSGPQKESRWLIVVMEETKQRDRSSDQDDHVVKGGQVIYGSVPADESVEKWFLCVPLWLKKEIKEVFNLAWTMVAVFFFYSCMAPLSLVFSGHLGTKELGGVALANTVIKVFGTTVGAGLATACDTVFSQTYGSGNKKEVGVHLQRGLMVILLFTLPCWSLMINTQGLLMLLGQEQEVARIAGSYLLIFLPALPFHFVYTILSRYLRNQGIVFPFLFIGFSGLAISILAQYLLVMYFDLGTNGSSIAQALGMISLFFLILCYILITKVYRETWGGLTVESFQGWGTFLSLAVYGVMMLSLQWFGFEIGTILSGTLGDIQLGAQSIMFQLETISYTFAIGTGVGCNIRVGHLLGAYRPKQAKRAVIAGYALVSSVSVVIVILFLSLKSLLPAIFSSDPRIIETASGIIPILALYNFFDQICGCSAGILRGCGRQRSAAAIVFLGMYMVGLPVGICLMLLTDLGTAGFWWGMTVAIFVESAAYFTAIMKIDWKGEADAAQIRAGLHKARANRPKQLSNDHEDDDETTVLIIDKETSEPPKAKPRRPPPQRKYCGEYECSQSRVNLSNSVPITLSTPQIIFRRSLFVLLMLLLLGLGVFSSYHFTITSSEPVNSTLVCIPGNWTKLENVTMSTNESMPFC